MKDPEQIQAELEKQLREAATAAQFLESDIGRLWMQFATGEITRLTREVTSDKYHKDMVGYNNALSDIGAYRKLMRMFQVGSSPARVNKIKQGLGEIDGE